MSLENSAKPPITLTAPDHDRLSGLVLTRRPRDEQSARALADELARARVVEPGAIAADVVTMNSHVRFKDMATGRTIGVTLVYPEDADIALQKVSVLTPVGAALIGLSRGQATTWRTRGGEAKRLVVVEVPFQPEANGRFDL